MQGVTWFDGVEFVGVHVPLPAGLMKKHMTLKVEADGAVALLFRGRAALEGRVEVTGGLAPGESGLYVELDEELRRSVVLELAKGQAGSPAHLAAAEASLELL